MSWFTDATTRQQLLLLSGAALVLIGAVLMGISAAALWSLRQQRRDKRNPAPPLLVAPAPVQPSPFAPNRKVAK